MKLTYHALSYLRFTISAGIGMFIAIIISTLIGIPMVLCYSIADGICLGILSYVLIKMMVGKFKDLNPTLYILSIFLLFNYVFS